MVMAMAITINRFFCWGFCLFLAIFQNFSLLAVEWDIQPHIEFKTDYSDNILHLEDENTPSFVGQINPALNLSGNGRRSEYLLNYRLQTLSYSNTLDDTYYQQAQGRFAYDIVDKSLLFHTDASLGQANKDIYSGGLNVDLNNPENITNIYRLQSGFTWQPQLQNKANLYLDTTASYLHENELLSNVRGWDVKFNTDSTYKINSGLWDLAYTGSERKPEKEDKTLLQKGKAQLGVQAWHHLAAFAIANREQNDIPDSVVDAELSTGSVGGGLRWQPNLRTMLSAAYNVGVYKDTPDFWSVDFFLKPNPRFSLEGSYGKRFYGDAYHFELSYQGRTIETQISYKEDISSYSRANIKEVTNDDEVLEPFTPVSTDVYLNRNIQWLITRITGRHSFIVNLSFSERDYINHSEGERDLAGQFDWHFFLNERSTLKFDSLYRRLNKSDRTDDFQTGETLQSGDEWQVGMSFERKLSRTSNLELRLEHTDKEGETNVSSYAENRVGLYYNLRTK